MGLFSDLFSRKKQQPIAQTVKQTEEKTENQIVNEPTIAEPSKNIRFIACICHDQPNINSLKAKLQKHIVDKEAKEGNIITPQTIIAFDSTRMASLLNDKSYQRQMLGKMLSSTYPAENTQGLIERLAHKGDFNDGCNVKFFVLYE